jgi:class 3 adenylate cyclase/tetratricopeptide (TPR) repeat protein
MNNISGRRQYLSILFADLSDSTQLAASMEAEQYAEIVDALRRDCRRIIPRHGGTIVQLLGDGVLAIFGFPAAQEGDGRRATEAALELHHAVRALPTSQGAAGSSLTLHTGIHSGLVLVAQGDAELGRLQLVGNVPNIAARLASVARRDEILVSRETLGPDTSFFRTGVLQHLTLRGTAEPVAVYRVLARNAVQTRFEASIHRGLAPFVGRLMQVRQLDHALEDALQGRSQCVVISAGAGLGKTRLAEEFLHRAARTPCQIHRGYCENLLGEPLQPFLQMLRRVFELDRGAEAPASAEALMSRLEQIDPALSAHAPELLRALSLRRDAERAENPIEALSALFQSLAAKAPQVVFIDDWQWADAASRQVLESIRTIQQLGVMVLIATRGSSANEPDFKDARSIELPPFTQQEASETVARVLPGTDPFIAQEIHKHAGGNPLFIEELCHSAAHEPIEQHLKRVRTGAAWLDTLIASRVQRLPEIQAELVRAAAVVGNVIPAWLFERITGYGECHPLVSSLAEHDFIFPGERPGTLRFKHGITREAVYRAVGLRERQPLHLRIAELLREHGGGAAEEEHHEALAYHYGVAGQSEESAHYAELAGNKAMSASALDRAQVQYRVALTALEQLPTSRQNDLRWIEVARQFALACVFDPSREQLPVLRRAVELARAVHDEAAIAKAHYWLGYINYGLGESGAAIHHCDRALVCAERVGDSPLVVQIRATLGQALAAACDYERAMPLLDEAIHIKRLHRTGARPAIGLSYTLTCKAAVLGDRGWFAQAEECFQEAADLLKGADPEVKASLYSWRSAVFLWQGRWQQAREAAMEARRVAERVKSLYLFAMSKALAGYADWMEHDDVAAVQVMQQSTKWLEERQRGQYISLNFGWLAEALVVKGELAAARSQVARAYQRARRRDRLGAAMASRAMARAEAQGEDRGMTALYLARAMGISEARQSRHEIAVTQLCAAEIAVARGQRGEAARLLDQATGAFESMAMHWHLQKARVLLNSV